VFAVAIDVFFHAIMRDHLHLMLYQTD